MKNLLQPNTIFSGYQANYRKAKFFLGTSQSCEKPKYYERN